MTPLRISKPTCHRYNSDLQVHITDNLLRQRGFDQLYGSLFGCYGKSTSNEELMREHGFVEIYDCGQQSFEWRKVMLTKKNWQNAFEILKFHANVGSKPYGGVYSFSHLDYSGLKELIEKKYILLSERQNYSPTVKQWYNLVEENDLQNKLYFHGYVVEADRRDRRISLEGIEADLDTQFTENQWKALRDITYSADSFHEKPLRCWWD